MYLVFTKMGMPKDQNQKLLLLGGWCNNYQKINKRDASDVRVLDYHWDDRDKFNKDYDRLEKIYESYLFYLSTKLNDIHGTDFDCQYWRVVIGPWLRFFLDVVFDRYECVLKAKDTGLVKDSLRLIYNPNDLVSDDFDSFYKSIVSDNWNQIIFDMCAKNIELPTYSKPEKYHHIARHDIISDQTNWKHALKKIICFVQSIYLSNSNIVFVGLYVSTITNLIVSASARQLPFLVEPELKLSPTAIDNKMREKLVIRQGKNKFEKFFETLIPLFIPKIYLENFLCARSKALNLYPKNPTRIFTSTAYQAKEGFKIWVAEQKKKNVPLIILQHGGNMGLSLRNQSEDHQLKIANQFLSWGWKRKNYHNITKSPPLQLLRQNINCRVDGSIAVLIGVYPKYFYCGYSVPFAGQYLKYADSIIDFVNNLDEKPKKLVELQLPQDIWNWGIKEYFDKNGLSRQIYSGKQNIYKRMSRARLCIITYNGTPLLEALHANVPTLILWNFKLFEIRDEAKKVFEELQRSGILHYDTASAINFTKMIYEDPAAWWNKASVQKARSLFCDSFVEQTNIPAYRWYCNMNHMLNVELKEQNNRKAL
jgi:putative transferase (TIGR04331 family)